MSFFSTTAMDQSVAQRAATDRQLVYLDAIGQKPNRKLTVSAAASLIDAWKQRRFHSSINIKRNPPP